jgi:hypothetical protein
MFKLAFNEVQVNEVQEFYCVCCGSLKNYKGYFTCSTTCASNYQNKKNTHWRTAGLSCKFCVECCEKHPSPAVNSSPYCSGNCRKKFKYNCRKMGNSEPRDRGNRRNQQGAQLVQQPRQQGNNWNRRNQQGAQLVQQPRQQGNNWNRGNQQSAQLVLVQPQQQYNNWNRGNPRNQQVVQLVQQRSSTFGKLVGSYNFM